MSFRVIRRPRRSVRVTSRRGPTTVHDVLNIKNLRLPEYPQVEDIRVTEYTDSLGDPAIEAFVRLADHPEGGDYHWEELKPIQDELFRAVQDAGDERFVYVHFATASELDEAE